MPDYLSTDTTAFSNISLYGGRIAAGGIGVSDLSVSRITATSQISTPVLNVSGGPTLSAGSLDLRTNTVVISLDTRADSSGMTTGQLRLVFAASGISLVYSSGATVYTVGASAVSAVQA